jgi:hypothetical protein
MGTQSSKEQHRSRSAARADTLTNQLARFRPPVTYAFIFTESEIFPPPHDPSELCGFKNKSAQHNFFLRAPPKGTKRLVCFICSERRRPTSFEDAHVTAFCFGLSRRSRDGLEFEVWHVGASRAHPYNDAARGTAWGVFPLTPAGPSRWTSGGTLVTRSNHEKRLHGSPNPFACMALVGAVVQSGADTAYQNAGLPCSKPFADRHSHKTHPGMTMIYRALGFQYERVGERYMNLNALDISSKMQRILDMMARGQACV